MSGRRGARRSVEGRVDQLLRPTVERPALEEPEVEVTRATEDGTAP